MTSLPNTELGSSLLRLRAERLAFLGAVDAIEADAFRMLVMQDFNGVAVENRDDAAGGRKWSTEDSARAGVDGNIPLARQVLRLLTEKLSSAGRGNGHGARSSDGAASGGFYKEWCQLKQWCPQRE